MARARHSHCRGREFDSPPVHQFNLIMFHFHKKPSLNFISFLSATGVFIYVTAVSWLLSNAEHFFGNVPEPNFLIPVFMLLLFVVSATVTGSLVLGKPLLMYLDGQKKEAVKLLFLTLGWLVAFLVMDVVLLLLQ